MSLSLGVLLALSVDGLHPNSQGGTVGLEAMDIKFDYPMCPELRKVLQMHIKRWLASVSLRVQKVGTAHVEPLILSSERSSSAATSWYGAGARYFLGAPNGWMHDGLDPKIASWILI